MLLLLALVAFRRLKPMFWRLTACDQMEMVGSNKLLRLLRGVIDAKSGESLPLVTAKHVRRDCVPIMRWLECFNTN